MKSLAQVIGELPARRRAKIAGRARALIAEEMALQHLREARRLTQQSMANSLNIGQDSVSRLEKRTDMLLSTLQSYIRALGGELRIVAEFKDGSVCISGIGDVAEDYCPAKQRRPVRTGVRAEKPAKSRQLARPRANQRN
jgi:transcriptional regulator with XRE-family HTH domain